MPSWQPTLRAPPEQYLSHARPPLYVTEGQRRYRGARLKRLARLALGLAAVSPFFLVAVCSAILVATVFLLPDALVRAPGKLPEAISWEISRHPALLFVAAAALFLAILLGTAIPLVFVFHAFYSERISEGRKSTWIVVLLLGGIIVAPFYWYHHIWRNPPTA